jgi:glycosyltransferase involved in cell wall biosynthesis
MRLVACSNVLRDFAGHAYNLALGLRAEMRARGVDLVILAHAAVPPDIAAKLDARPTFQYSPFDDLQWDAAVQRPPDLARFGGQFADDLQAAQVGNADVLFVACARHYEVHGVGEWVARHRAKEPPVAAFNFMVNGFNREPAWELDAYRKAFARLFASLPRERVILSSSSENIVASARLGAGVDMAHYPMPKFVPRLDDATRPPNPIPVVGMLGAFNLYNRATRMPGIAEAAAGRGLRCRFLVQGPAGDDIRSDLVAAHRKLRSLHNVELIERDLDFDGYFNALFACDVVLMPYNRRRYETTTSGIFSEAVAFAKIVVVPAGTWMAQMLAAGQGAGVTFDALTPQAIVDALERALADYEALSQLAQGRAAAWRRNDGLPVFLDRLLADVATRRG